MNQFIQHWSDLNTTLGSAVILAGGRTAVMFINWLGQVENAITNTSAAVIAAATRKAELDTEKANLIAWTVIFNATVRSEHGELSLVNTLVTAPGQSDGRGLFLQPVAQTQQLWADLNVAVGVPVEIKRRRVLPDGTLATETLEMADYVALLADVQAKWNEWDRAVKKAENVREGRNDVMKLAYDAMRDYRLKVPLELPPGHALLDSLPLLNPDPAQRPDAPEASGVWDAGAAQAVLTAVPSTSAEVTVHNLCWSPAEGGYDANNEVVLTAVPPGQPLTFSTDIGLAVPGDVSRFTWVAVTGNGHEGRSNVVEVVRV